MDTNNKIIYDTLVDKYNAAKNGEFEGIEAIIADFDGVTFHLSTPDQNAKNLLTISMSIKCYSALKKCGADDIMKQNYGEILRSPENGYDVTVQIDLSKPPSDIDAFAKNVSLMKRNAFAAPFYKVFADIEKKSASAGLIEIRYRDDEAFYIKQETDRTIVVFEIAFRDADDVVLAKLFLQEYQDARRSMNNVPSVSYSQKEPPLELKGSSARAKEGTGFVSFVLFAPHMSGKKKESSIDLIENFRNYLQYHIKCSKAYMHTRMRNRVRSFLQVLNRAKSDPQKVEKKTITGKTFSRADDTPSTLEFNI